MKVGKKVLKSSEGPRVRGGSSSMCPQQGAHRAPSGKVATSQSGKTGWNAVRGGSGHMFGFTGSKAAKAK